MCKLQRCVQITKEVVCCEKLVHVHCKNIYEIGREFTRQNNVCKLQRCVYTGRACAQQKNVCKL